MSNILTLTEVLKIGRSADLWGAGRIPSAFWKAVTPETFALAGSVTADSHLDSVFSRWGGGTSQMGAPNVLPGDKTMIDLQLLNSEYASEQDFRLAVLNSLLRTPHRNVTPFVPLFSRLQEKDPLFFSRGISTTELCTI